MIFTMCALFFPQINPQHTVPTLVDADENLSLWESRAIMVYLVEKYGKTASLYPSDPKARAVVNQRLYFDLGTLYQRLADYYYPQIFAKAPANPENLKKLEDAVGFLNTFLEGQTYAVRFHFIAISFCLNKINENHKKLQFECTKNYKKYPLYFYLGR